MPDSIQGLLQAHTCLYASFDRSLDADVGRGDPTASCRPTVARHSPSLGRFGGALMLDAKDYGWAEDEFTYPAEGNFPYRPDGFSGTVSMWLSLDPDADLSDDVPVDPFHISRRAADGSFYLDLTRPNDDRYGSPRKLRFGIYNDSPENDRFANGQLIVVGDLGWRSGQWHHVVATWRNANSGREDGAAEVYVDGALRGWMAGYRHRVTWEISEMTIGLGQRYSGGIDEVLILDTALDQRQVTALYRLDGPAAEWVSG